MCHKWQTIFKSRPEEGNDPQPDPAVQPKARVLLHMEREYITHHIKRKNSRLEHLIASMQPKKHSNDCTKHSKDSEIELSALEVPEALGHADRSPEALKVPNERL